MGQDRAAAGLRHSDALALNLGWNNSRYAGRKIMNEERIESSGVKIFVRSWQPVGKPRGVVVICHGVKSHSGYYLWTGEQFAELGCAVYALDLRGRGKSDGDRLFVDNISEYTGDVATVIATAKARHPGLPVFLLGHSAGGVVSCCYALDHQGELAGLICESFAYRVYAPDIALLALKGIGAIAPHLPVLKLHTKDFSRDPAVLQAMKDDPLGVDQENQPAETMAALIRATERLRVEFSHITLPVLILHGTADKATVPAGSQEFFDHAGSRDKTLKLYEGHFHDLLNDIDKQKVMADIKAWVAAHLPAA
jgi:alpha-beta hydrolase superfamily lysophospholipase